MLLSRNQWFVPVFFEIMIKKINAYRGMDVAFGMTLISKWLQQCESLPTNFQYNSFFNVLQVLDERFDHEVAIERCLLLLYNNLHKFPLKNRFAILEALLAPALFNRLFFHWSFNVRKVFHRLLLF